MLLNKYPRPGNQVWFVVYRINENYNEMKVRLSCRDVQMRLLNGRQELLNGIILEYSPKIPG
jgi:hypothetical protein